MAHLLPRTWKCFWQTLFRLNTVFCVTHAFQSLVSVEDEHSEWPITIKMSESVCVCGGGCELICESHQWPIHHLSHMIQIGYGVCQGILSHKLSDMNLCKDLLARSNSYTLSFWISNVNYNEKKMYQYSTFLCFLPSEENVILL